MEILGDRIAARLLEEIVDGEHQPGSLLPSEAELARREGVSRLTIREALKVLREKAVVDVQRGRGSVVTSPDQWNALDPVVLRALSHDHQGFMEQTLRLYEVRQLVEVGTAELSAMRRSEPQLAEMEAAIRRSVEARDDLEESVVADLEFHRAVMRGADNPAITTLFGTIEEVLREVRRTTSQERDARDRAIRAHERILEAIRLRSPERARWAMHEHLVEGIEDLRAKLDSFQATQREADDQPGSLQDVAAGDAS